MRIGLDPNRWNRPPRKKTWMDRYFNCWAWFMVGSFFVVLALLLLWSAWNWVMATL